MSAPINDGGPAFPSAALDERKMEAAWLGMTLRDWFAGQALAGLSVACPGDDVASVWDWAGLAKTAYVAADAMLAVRAGGAK